MMSIADNIGGVTRRIQKATLAAGRDSGGVRLLAVSKKRSAEELRQAYSAGQSAFGENYVQEALEKQAQLTDLPGIEWHFIGPVQSNKTRDIAESFAWVHSVDRLKIATRLSEQRPEQLPPLQICLQVNIDGEDSKSGCHPDELESLAEEIGDLPRLSLRGLMAIPDPDQPEHVLRESFRALRNALKRLRRDFPEAGPLDTLSMGMSADLEAAVAEGATLVRVGTDIFGPRSGPSKQE